jgi:hypothetical protein
MTMPMKPVLCVAQVFLVFSLGSAQVQIPARPAAEIRVLAGAEAPLVERIGFWPYGPCEAAAIDAARNIAVIGNGETLQVLDISNHFSPSKIGEVELEGNPQDIVISGRYVYLVTRSLFTVVDLADARNPRLVSQTIFMGMTEFTSLSRSADLLFVAGSPGLLICDISDPEDPVFRSWYGDAGWSVIDVAVWGTYAVCAFSYWKYPEHPDRTDGVGVIDVSVPSSPQLRGTYEAEPGAAVRQVDVLGDGVAAVCFSNDPLKKGILSLIDIALDPGSPREVGRYERSDLDFAGLALSGNYGYLFQRWPGHLVSLDLSQRNAPIVVSDLEVAGYFHHLCATGTVLGISQEGHGFSMYNIVNPGHPSPFGSYDTPDTMDASANGIAAYGDYVYMASGSDGLRVMDVSDLSDPREAGICPALGGDSGLIVSGRYAYGVENAGINIFNISDPRSPSLVAYLGLPCAGPPCDVHYHNGIAVGGSYAYVTGTQWSGSDMRAMLTIVDVSDPSQPGLVKSFLCAYQASSYGAPALLGHYLYLAVSDFSQGEDDRRFGLRVIDVADPRAPREVYFGISDLPLSEGRNVVLKGGLAFVSGDWLRIFDLSNPEVPEPLVFYPLPCWSGIAVSGSFAYLASDKLWIVDVSDPRRSSTTAVHYLGEPSKGVATAGNLAFVSGSLSVFRNNWAPEVSISSPAALSTLVGTAAIDVQASHDSGIQRVDLYVDGAFIASDFEAPYSFAWDTKPYQDGLHKIRVEAFDGEGLSSDLERDVITRLVHAPLDFSGVRRANRSLSQAETVDALSWRAHPDNVDIATYKIYQVDDETSILLGSVDAGTLTFWSRNVQAGTSSTYALVALNNAGRESEPVYVTIR